MQITTGEIHEDECRDIDKKKEAQWTVMHILQNVFSRHAIESAFTVYTLSLQFIP